MSSLCCWIFIRHCNAAVAGECIFNVEPAWFESCGRVLLFCRHSSVESFGAVREEDWTMLEKADCHPAVLAIGEAGLDRLGPADILLQMRSLSDKFY